MSKTTTKEKPTAAETGNKPGTAVATANTTAIVNAPPAEIAAFMDEDAGKGAATRASEIGIPFLGILQDLSPQVKKRDPAYIEGAEVGMIINTGSKEIYAGEDGVLFIPCFYKTCNVEWTPRDKGGGWVAEHPIDTPLLRGADRPDPKKPPRLKNGNDLIETRYYFGIQVLPNGGYELAVIGMSSSALKTSREWQQQIGRVKTPSGAKAPSFAKAYRLKTVLRKKADNEWFGWDIAPERWVTSSEYNAARELEAQVAAGAVQAAQPDASVAPPSDGEDEVL